MMVRGAGPDGFEAVGPGTDKKAGRGPVVSGPRPVQVIEADALHDG